MSLSIKQIQDRLLQTILERSSQAIVFVDGQAKIKIWNRAAERLFGISSQQAPGESFFQLVLPADAVEEAEERFGSRAWEAERGADATVFSEVQVKLANGMQVWTDQVAHHFRIEGDHWTFLEIVMRNRENGVRRNWNALRRRMS